MSKDGKIVMSQEGAEQLWGEIENQGFGYWVLEYGYDEAEDPKLAELSKKAKKAMKKLDKHIRKIWDEYEIG